MPSARSLIEQHIVSFKTDSDGEGHKLFPRNDWRYEVDNNDTNLGYGQWLEDKIEFEVDEIMDEIDRFLLRVSKLPGGEISEIEFNQDVLGLFSDMRLSDVVKPLRNAKRATYSRPSHILLLVIPLPSFLSACRQGYLTEGLRQWLLHSQHRHRLQPEPVGLERYPSDQDFQPVSSRWLPGPGAS